MGSNINIKSDKVTDLEPTSLGIIVEKPKFPHFASKSNRLESFATWPDSHTINKNNLVEAGFVFTGVGDSVRCYYCGGGLKNWETGDDPMKEHARWFPKCPHVLLVKGQDYVDKINRAEDEETAEVEGIDSTAAKSCMEMGYSRNMIGKAIAVYKEKYGNIDFSTAQLCEVLFDLDSDTEESHSDGSSDSVESENLEDIRQLQAENNQLKEQQLCKICLDGKADVIFLPCGHVVVCPQCAPALTVCPLCKVTINGNIKVILSNFAK